MNIIKQRFKKNVFYMRFREKYQYWILWYSICSWEDFFNPKGFMTTFGMRINHRMGYVTVIFLLKILFGIMRSLLRSVMGNIWRKLNKPKFLSKCFDFIYMPKEHQVVYRIRAASPYQNEEIICFGIPKVHFS